MTTPINNTQNNALQAAQERVISEASQKGAVTQSTGITNHGHIGGENLSISHTSSTEVMPRSTSPALPPPQPDATGLMAGMSPEDLHATLTGLQMENTEVQLDSTREAVMHRNEETERQGSERLESLKNELAGVEQENKCAQTTAKICLCIPGINVLVGLPAKIVAEKGDDKADSIRAQIAVERFGPEDGAKIAQLMKDFEAAATIESFVPGKHKRDQMIDNINDLHSRGVFDSATQEKLLGVVNQKDLGTFGVKNDLEEILTNFMLGTESQPAETVAMNALPEETGGQEQLAQAIQQMPNEDLNRLAEDTDEVIQTIMENHQNASDANNLNTIGRTI